MLIHTTTTLKFDTAAIDAYVTKHWRTSAARAGAYVRRTIARSFRPQGASLQPGRPPRSITGALKGNIRFAYDPAQRDVVVGPLAIKHQTGDLPALLEYGGTARVTVWPPAAARIPGQPALPRRVLARYRAFPYVTPQQPLLQRQMAAQLRR